MFCFHSAELYVGIIAASLPTLRPLFSIVLDSASKGIYNYSNQHSSTHPRSQYYRQEDVVLSSMERGTATHGYNARVLKTSERRIRTRSSEESMLPPKEGISRRTDVTILRE